MILSYIYPIIIEYKCWYFLSNWALIFIKKFIGEFFKTVFINFNFAIWKTVSSFITLKKIDVF